MNPLNKRLHKGESSAFVELYDLLEQKLFRYVYSQVGTVEDAADIVQETFVRLVKSHRALGKASNLNSYVFAAARNETIRWLNKHSKLRKAKMDSSANLDELPEPNQTAGTIDDQEWVKSVLASLDPLDQEIVQLKVYSQLTFQEIADITQLAQPNVATRYRRAITRLERMLAPTHGDSKANLANKKRTEQI